VDNDSCINTREVSSRTPREREKLTSWTREGSYPQNPSHFISDTGESYLFGDNNWQLCGRRPLTPQICLRVPLGHPPAPVRLPRVSMCNRAHDCAHGDGDRSVCSRTLSSMFRVIASTMEGSGRAESRKLVNTPSLLRINDGNGQSQTTIKQGKKKKKRYHSRALLRAHLTQSLCSLERVRNVPCTCWRWGVIELNHLMRLAILGAKRMR